jgi:hypothetical protein
MQKKTRAIGRDKGRMAHVEMALAPILEENGWQYLAAGLCNLVATGNFPAVPTQPLAKKKPDRTRPAVFAAAQRDERKLSQF